MAEPENQFSLTRAALSTGVRAKSKFLSVSVSVMTHPLLIWVFTVCVWFEGAIWPCAGLLISGGIFPDLSG